MPVYLAPISRRGFLKGSLSAAAVIAAGQCVARESAGDGQTWALLSDIHISANTNLVHNGAKMARNLEKVVDEIAAWPMPVSGALINGDLAFDDGEVADYKAVLGLLEPMRKRGAPIHLTLGNHDHRERFWETLPDEKSVTPNLADRQTAIVRTRYANWFILDSLIETRETPGRLGPAQRDWLAKALDENKDKPALVAIHHQPAFATASGNGSLETGAELIGVSSALQMLAAAAGALQDTTELMEILRPRRHVKAYFFGHTHRWSVQHDSSGLCLINFPPVAYVFEKGRPNGWVHATLLADGARLELRCLDRTHKDHGQVVNLEWRT
jgi:Icc protein